MAAGLRGAFEHSGEEGYGIVVERTGDRNELCHIDPTLERLDPLDPVGRNPELAGELSLGNLSVPSGGRNGGGDGPTAVGIFHDGALMILLPGASITVSQGLIRNS